MAIKPLVCVSSLLLLACSGFAQSCYIGIRGGVNIASTDFLNRKGTYKDVSSLEAIGVAIPCVIILSKTFSIQAELAFAQKGNSIYKTWIDENGLPLNIDRTRFVLNYLEIPLLAKWSFGTKSLGFDLFTGPAISYGMGGYYAYGDRNTFTVQTQKFSFKDANLRNPDLSINFGIALHARNIFADLRYQFGILDIAKDESIAKRIYNRVLSLNIGCLIPIATLK